MKEKKLIVKALAGLANRMRVIESAVALSRQLNRQLTIIWNKESALNCRYEDLFQPLEDFQVRHDWYDSPRTLLRPWESITFVIRERLGLKLSIAGHTWIYDKHPSILNGMDFSTFYDGKSLFISTAHRFGSADVISRMKPLPELEERIETICRQYGTNTYGVHIRRGDSRLSKQKSPGELFVGKMHELADADPGARFFLASDDTLLKEAIIREFAGKIIVNSHIIRRNNKEGIRNALVDMYCLSRTRKIFGSFYSSFSATSAMISRIPFEVLHL